MKKMRERCLVLLVIALAAIHLTGCASGPEPVPRLATEPQNYDAEFDRVWNAVNDVLTEQRLPIRTIEKDSGLVTTDWVSSGGRYIYWGKKDEAGHEISTWAVKTRYFLNVRVKDGDGGDVVVDVLSHVEYMKYRYVKGVGNVEDGWESCQSHGDIEREIYNALATKLNR